MTKDCIAIITARGGSKRIPRKNIKLFLGVPLIKYCISAALDSDIFNEVMVSTDDIEIAEIARGFGAEVPFLRSKMTSHDHATTYSVIEEVIRSYGEKKMRFRYGCCLYPSPFINRSKLIRGYNMLLNSTAEAVIPVVRFNYPVLRSFKIENNLLKMNWPEHISRRSQDLPTFYHDCGQFYFFNTQSLLKQKKMFLNSTIPYEIPESESHDIDVEEDWKIAELKYKLLTAKKDNHYSI